MHTAADIFPVCCRYTDAFAQFIRGNFTLQASKINQPFHYFTALDLEDIEPRLVGRQTFRSFLIVQ